MTGQANRRECLFFFFYPFFFLFAVISLLCRFPFISAHRPSNSPSFFFCCLTAEYLVVFVFFCVPRFFFLSWLKVFDQHLPLLFFYFGRVLFLFSAFFFLLSFVKHHSVQLQNLNRHFRIRSFNDTFFLTLFACFLFLFLYFQIPQRVRRCAYTETFLFSFSVLLFFFCFLSFLLCAFKYT